MNINPQTNLPELPEGYFWRVQSTANSYLHVLLHRKRRAWFGSERIAYRSVPTWGFPDGEGYSMLSPETIAANISEAAAEIIENAERRLTEEDAIQQFLGDYPPKKLGA